MATCRKPAYTHQSGGHGAHDGVHLSRHSGLMTAFQVGFGGGPSRGFLAKLSPPDAQIYQAKIRRLLTDSRAERSRLGGVDTKDLKRQAADDTVPGMSKFTASDVLALPVPERLQLVEDIWNTIADAPDALELTEEDKRLIDERLEACRQIPGAGSPLEEVLARIAARKK